MAKTYIPPKDADFLSWAINYSGLITLSPTSYGLTAPIATLLATKTTLFSTTLAAATNPATRGGATVLAKDQARFDLEKYCREVAGAIQGTLTVTPAQKFALGLTVRQTHPSPIPAPAFAPDLDILSGANRTVRIRLHDSQAVDRRGKPPFVAGAAVYSFVGATPPASLDDWKFEGNTTRTTVQVSFDNSVAIGATAWLAARWFNAKLQNGPGCNPVSTNVPGGLTLAA